MSNHRTVLATCAVAISGLFAGDALASHAGATATCSNGATFTVRATENSAGSESPSPFTAILFEAGGVLTVQSIRVNGNLVFSRAETGRARNAVTEVTCSFTAGARIGGNAVFEVTGMLNVR